MDDKAMTPEQARKLLRAAGVLVEYHVVPPEARSLTAAELERIGRLAAGAPTILELILEDRGAQ